MSAVKEDPEVLDEYGSSVNEESTEENETENVDDERTEDDTQDPDDPVRKHVSVSPFVTFYPVQELEAIKARVRDMEEEAEKLRQMQEEVEKQMNSSSTGNVLMPHVSL